MVETIVTQISLELNNDFPRETRSMEMQCGIVGRIEVVR